MREQRGGYFIQNEQGKSLSEEMIHKLRSEGCKIIGYEEYWLEVEGWGWMTFQAEKTSYKNPRGEKSFFV